MGVALVTGPTAGIGRQIAVELSLQGHDLILVARDRSRLDELATELGNAEVLPADLSDRDQLAGVEQAARDVDWLVNNAGYGITASFTQSRVEDEQSLLDVLVTAPMRLSHAALPAMIAKGAVASSMSPAWPDGCRSARTRRPRRGSPCSPKVWRPRPRPVST